MEVTNIRVSFMREKQPVQYEKAAPMVELAGTISDGENHLTAARNLMLDAASIVYAGIGYAVPEKVAEALAAVAPGVTIIGKDTAKVEVKGSAKDEVAPKEGTKAAKKPRGRPKGTGNKKTPEAEVKKIVDDAKQEAASKEEALAAAGIPGDEIPGDEIPGDNISSGNEDRVDPAQNVQDDATFTPKDLHDLIIGHVKATPRTLSMDNARGVLAHFKVARAQDLTNEQALEGRTMVDQMVAEEAAAA